ncbi:MAG TPA: Mur ligase domain-containing protein [Thermotogota bacterium]|nr:Mur ligase domain-containing protein [Thermotogota bacterium]
MRVHFIGIGGIGMSGVALLAKDLGIAVTGSVDRENERTLFLQTRGIQVFEGHCAKNLGSPDVVVYTNAVHADNVEWKKAREMDLPLLPRLTFLSHILKKAHKPVIGISGTDGKTTTTAMVAHILQQLGKDPTVLLGGIHESLRFGNYHPGVGPVVIEVDESDGFLTGIFPQVAAITNINGDHLEHYDQDFGNYRRAMFQFLQNAHKRVLPLSEKEGAALYQLDGAIPGSMARFFCREDPVVQGEVLTALPGKYNQENALCAVQCCSFLGIEPEKGLAALRDFHFVDRRFSHRYESEGLVVIDDYAHTPLEIESVIWAARETYPDHELLLAVEIHRYTRLRREMEHFLGVIGKAPVSRVMVLPVYSAYEETQPGLFSSFLHRLAQLRAGTRFCKNPEHVLQALFEGEAASSGKSSKPKLLLFVGAGRSSQYSRQLSAMLPDPNQRPTAAGYPGGYLSEEVR